MHIPTLLPAAVLVGTLTSLHHVQRRHQPPSTCTLCQPTLSPLASILSSLSPRPLMSHFASVTSTATLPGPTISKQELGRATWTLLHTLAAQYPEDPTSSQQRDVKSLIDILTRIYPCAECSRHFAEIVKAKPPRVKSGTELRAWMCHVHNVVNRSIGRPEFNCDLIDSRWGRVACETQEDSCRIKGRGGG